MLVMKCSRLLRFDSRPSVKLLKAVIGICPRIVCQLVWLLRPALITFSREPLARTLEVGIPNIGYDLPCPISLFFEDLDVLAAVLNRLTVGVSHRLFVGAAHVGEIAGLGYFHLGRLPTYGSAGRRQHFFPGAPNSFPCRCTRSVRRHDDGVLG